MSLIINMIKVARPIHWVKNLSLFAALIFTQTLLIRSYFYTVVWAFIAFNLITSASYILNDILDAKTDRLHPIKKKRPIAAGKMPLPLALFELFFLALASLFL